MHIDEATRLFLKAHANDDPFRLMLSASQYPHLDMPFIVTQIEGRRRVSARLPLWAANDAVVFPEKLSLEQCSSEQTAKYKARLVAGCRVADLTGGFGVDAFYMSQKARSVVYVEKNEELAAVARHNFGVLGAGVETIAGDGTDFLARSGRQFDVIYLDPARRDGANRKMVGLADCDPNVLQNKKLIFGKASGLLLKASPMLDVGQAIKELGGVRSVHVLAVRNECRELLFECSEGTANGSVTIRCVNYVQDREEVFDFTREEEREAVATYTEMPARYLYEPNASVMKAGAFKTIALRFGLHKFHPDTHLYTSGLLITGFPGRIFEISDSISLNDKELRRIVPSRKVNVATRNYPLKTAEICRKFKLTDGGDDYLFALTFADNRKGALLCRKVVSVPS
jgi:hypothetical protein